MGILAFLQNSLTQICILLSPIGGALALLIAWKIFKVLRDAESGTPEMRTVAERIRSGAFIFLSAEYRLLLPVILITAAVLGVTPGLGGRTATTFLVGAICSALAGLVGMNTATVANLRTVAAAKMSGEGDALIQAFRGGAVIGVVVGGLGLLGIGIFYFLLGDERQIHHLAGFMMGASFVALFARVGGGIFTKGADIGADLVGKVEAGIPEDDPRNPGVIADNVGDNVGAVVGMGADLFESYVGAIIASMLLAATLSAGDVETLTIFNGQAETLQRYRGALMGVPLVLALIGLLSSLIGIAKVESMRGIEPKHLLRQGTIVSVGAFLAGSFVFILLSSVSIFIWVAAFAGAASGIMIGAATEYFTSERPVAEIVHASRGGPATNIIQGIATGLRSVPVPITGIVFAILVANWAAGIYGVGIGAVSMLATISFTMCVSAYGPIIDNAGGIAQLAALDGEVRGVTDRLDLIGSSTAAIGKGFAIGSAALTAIALFSVYSQAIASPEGGLLSLNSPLVIIGVLLGGALPAAIAALTIAAVGKTAALMVDEIRRQFQASPEILSTGVGANSDRCVDIATKGALREMIFPGIVAVISPVVVGFVFGAGALGGLVIGTMLSGVVLALFMANAGGAWDKAKKLVESGAFSKEGRGSLLHRATIIGDTVGDPLKDSAGPSMNILLKLVSVVAVVIAPLL